MLIHTSQIQSLNGSFASLYEQLKALEIDNSDVDIVYEINEQGQVVSETFLDMSLTTPEQVKKIVYSYNADGVVETETLTIGPKSVTKTYIYDEITGAVVKVSIRNNPITESV